MDAQTETADELLPELQKAFTALLRVLILHRCT